MRKVFDCTSPFRKSGLSSIDLLSPSDQCHDHCPIGAPIHHIKHHFGLGHFWTPRSLVLFAIPRTLCFVKDDHILNWLLFSFAIILIGKPMDTVHERPYFQLCLAAAHAFTPDHVSNESFLKYFNERPVARQKYAEILYLWPVYHIEAHQSLARTWYSRREADNFLCVGACA